MWHVYQMNDEVAWIQSGLLPSRGLSTKPTSISNNKISKIYLWTDAVVLLLPYIIIFFDV
jgi:hypothetical protein